MKKLIIKTFLRWINQAHGEDGMWPEYIKNRWYGVNSRFYNKIWGKLDGNNDPYLFDDFCDMGFDVHYGDGIKLQALTGQRLQKLYRFARAMLLHYILVSAFWNIVGWLIRYVAYPVSTAANFVWLGLRKLLAL
jgi:hypothetical protein